VYEIQFYPMIYNRARLL